MKVTIDPDFIKEWATSDDCRDLMLDVAHKVEGEFRDIVPRRTGNLAASAISVPIIEDGAWGALVDTRIYYAAFVEFGTRYMDAQYNLKHALENITGDS